MIKINKTIKIKSLKKKISKGKIINLEIIEMDNNTDNLVKISKDFKEIIRKIIVLKILIGIMIKVFIIMMVIKLVRIIIKNKITM